ncbi:MAG TPA: AMP-binding protein [Candidatus Paceibacterota bacterium]|nr:AMP-binding protein [Candidatus Paceibacterota bacterium]
MADTPKESTAELAALASLVTDVVASPYSAFYRELYNVPAGSVPNLHTWNDWQLVPTFSKEHMLERPMHEYTFARHKDIDAVYYTSGTSGKPPVFCARMPYIDGLSFRKEFYDFKGALLSSIKVQHRSDDFLAEIGSPSLTINFDGKHLAACVRLAKAAGVDSLGVHTFTIQAIGEEMKKVGINKNIRLINFVGETCSLMLYSYMRETFPNAKITGYYGLTEAEGAVAVPCREMDDEQPYPVLHAHPEFHLDIIDSATGNALPIEPGIEGEILVTDLHPGRALQLVRYRPGDTIRVVEAACKAHGKWTFTVLGKTASDFMLVPGGELRADEIERVLRTMPEVTDHFEMHRYDGGTKERPMLEISLHVQTLTKEVDLQALALRIQKELRVSPNRIYQNGVDEGVYAPLRCVPLLQPNADKKHKRMFKHSDVSSTV